MISINHAGPECSLPLTPTINGISNCPKEIDSAVKAQNDEPQKFEESGKGPDTFGVSKPRDNPSDSSPSQLNDLAPHVINKASLNRGQGRVLPSWTRRNRPATLSEIPPA